MMNNTTQDLNELKRKRRKHVKINSWSCLLAFIVAVVSMIFNFVVEFSEVDTKISLPFAITMIVLTLLCLIPMIISWAKLRKIERTLKQNGVEDFEEEKEEE